MRGSVKFLPSVLLCLVVFGIPVPVAAQAPDVPMIDVSAGYNYLNGKVPSERTGTEESVSYTNGWYADLAITMPSPTNLSIVGQINMSYKTIDDAEAGMRGYMGGVRWNVRNIQQAVPFVQFLAGGTNSKFGNAGDGFDEWTVFYTWQIGGGVAFMLTEKVGLRVGADFQRVQGKTDSTIMKENFNMMRIGAGINLPFGTR